MESMISLFGFVTCAKVKGLDTLTTFFCFGVSSALPHTALSA